MAECGSCTLCCKLLAVGDLRPEKPANKWCDHCTPGKGCGIYQDRPQSCQDFECGWLSTDGLPSYRPDKIHIIIAGESDRLDAYILHVDPGYPQAHKERRAANMIKGLRQGRHKNVLLICGSERTLLTYDQQRYIPMFLDALKAKEI